MVSNVRFHSFKDLDLRGRVPFMTILVVVVLFVFVSSDPPLVLFVGTLGYAGSGPILTLWSIRKRRAARRAGGRGARQAASRRRDGLRIEPAGPETEVAHPSRAHLDAIRDPGLDPTRGGPGREVRRSSPSAGCADGPPPPPGSRRSMHRCASAGSARCIEPERTPSSEWAGRMRRACSSERHRGRKRTPAASRSSAAPASCSTRCWPPSA